ncbi:unnamed protein product [Lathyrus sativus]|nr:unnamed protein product [Lathyrus sativus]
MAKSNSLVILALFTILFVKVIGRIPIDSRWQDAHATFYGDINGGETMQGACGYGNLFDQGYGLETTALSTTLFNEGYTCGACFEIKCVNDPQWCKTDVASITVTATNFCPPNYSKPDGNWCNPPQKHFDLTMKMYTTIAIYESGIVPVQYRRVPCVKSGGVRFELRGNPYFLMVLIYNVANAGDIVRVAIKGSNSDWVQMIHNWGQVWHTGLNLVGQDLTFWVTTSDKKSLQFISLAPSNWQFGQTYEGSVNF